MNCRDRPLGLSRMINLPQIQNLREVGIKPYFQWKCPRSLRVPMKLGRSNFINPLYELLWNSISRNDIQGGVDMHTEVGAPLMN